MKTTLRLSFLSLAISALLIGCGKQDAIIEAHNELVKIEQSMVNRYNASFLAQGQADALDSAIREVEKIDVSDCPDDYQEAWRDVIKVWRDWKAALGTGNIDLADELNERSQAKIKKLNRVATSHGVKILGSL